MLFIIDAPTHPTHFYAAVITGPNWTITQAAPILGWSVGKQIAVLYRWCKRHGHSFIPVCASSPRLPATNAQEGET